MPDYNTATQHWLFIEFKYKWCGDLKSFSLYDEILIDIYLLLTDCVNKLRFQKVSGCFDRHTWVSITTSKHICYQLRQVTNKLSRYRGFHYVLFHTILSVLLKVMRMSQDLHSSFYSDNRLYRGGNACLWLRKAAPSLLCSRWDSLSRLSFVSLAIALVLFLSGQ